MSQERKRGRTPKYLIIREHEYGCDVMILNRKMTKFEMETMRAVNGIKAGPEKNTLVDMANMLISPGVFDWIWTDDPPQVEDGETDREVILSAKMNAVPKEMRGTLEKDLVKWKFNEMPACAGGPYEEVFFFCEVN